MPYPFGFPSLAGFQRSLKEKFQCEYKTLPSKLKDEEGNEHEITYFERNFEQQKLRCVVVLAKTEYILPSVVRSICRRLKINPKDLDIGLHLG